MRDVYALPGESVPLPLSHHHHLGSPITHSSSQTPRNGSYQQSLSRIFLEWSLLPSFPGEVSYLSNPPFPPILAVSSTPSSQATIEIRPRRHHISSYLNQESAVGRSSHSLTLASRCVQVHANWLNRPSFILPPKAWTELALDNDCFVGVPSSSDTYLTHLNCARISQFLQIYRSVQD